MQSTAAKYIVGLLSVPFLFRLLESVNGPWPVPFKWPEVILDAEDFDTNKGLYEEPLMKRVNIEVPSRTINILSICRYSRKCVPSSIKFPTKIVSAPAIGLASCISGGILSDELEALTCYLERKSVIGDITNLSPHQIDKFCGATNKFHSIMDMSRNIRVRLRDMRAWTFVMITRDPVERFIHGFIKHCIEKQSSCYECGNDIECFADTYHLRLQQFALYNEENYENISEMDWDLFPQTWMCDVEQWKEKYKLLRYSRRINEVIGNLTGILKNRHIVDIDRILRLNNWQSNNYKNNVYSEIRRRIEDNSRLQNVLVMMYHNDFRVLGYKYL